ncbi:hypothetical protein LJB89_03890 [Tyzzerella sp. OttesenSCG-928-J15]|nr:hypothetical protein [Tyzzerella sp. OttesenSCG-928-J15]
MTIKKIHPAPPKPKQPIVTGYDLKEDKDYIYSTLKDHEQAINTTQWLMIASMCLNTILLLVILIKRI